MSQPSYFLQFTVPTMDRSTKSVYTLLWTLNSLHISVQYGTYIWYIYILWTIKTAVLQYHKTYTRVPCRERVRVIRTTTVFQNGGARRHGPQTDTLPYVLARAPRTSPTILSTPLGYRGHWRSQSRLVGTNGHRFCSALPETGSKWT